MAVRARSARRHGRHAGDRRSRAGVARRCARDGNRGAQRRAARRSAAARAGLAGHASRGHGPLGARAPARRQPTIPPNMGLFLERTRRMHPDVCRFISEIVYDNRLDGRAGARAPGDRIRHGAAVPAGRAQRECGRVVRGGGCDRRRDRQDGRIVVDRSRRGDSAAGPERLHGRRAVQRAGATAARRVATGRPRRRRGRNRRQVPGTRSGRCCSTRWRRRASRTFRAASSSCSRATG